MAMGSPAFSPPEMLMATRNEGASYDGAWPLPVIPQAPIIPALCWQPITCVATMLQIAAKLNTTYKLVSTLVMTHRAEQHSDQATPLPMLRAAASPSKHLKSQCTVFIEWQRQIAAL